LPCDSSPRPYSWRAGGLPLLQSSKCQRHIDLPNYHHGQVTETLCQAKKVLETSNSRTLTCRLDTTGPRWIAYLSIALLLAHPHELRTTSSRKARYGRRKSMPCPCHHRINEAAAVADYRFDPQVLGARSASKQLLRGRPQRTSQSQSQKPSGSRSGSAAWHEPSCGDG